MRRSRVGMAGALGGREPEFLGRCGRWGAAPRRMGVPPPRGGGRGWSVPGVCRE